MPLGRRRKPNIIANDVFAANKVFHGIKVGFQQIVLIVLEVDF